MSLVEFGDEAYVITPFTTDYENILLSISLIGDWSEFMAFPDQGTMIASAIDQGVGLFKAFDFLDASGNLMVIFTDGVDAEICRTAGTAFDVLRDAERAKIPVYFIRTGGQGADDPRLSDRAWQAAVARTGGRFYPAADENAILRAVKDDRRRVDREDFDARVRHAAAGVCAVRAGGCRPVDAGVASALNRSMVSDVPVATD